MNEDRPRSAALTELQKERSIQLDDLVVAMLPRISQYGGDVIHGSLSGHAEETLQEALRERTTV